MRKTAGQDKHFSRRALLAAALGGGFFSLLIGRLYQLQFLRAEKYKTLAEGNRIKLQLVPPARGVIEDRYGIPLSLNQKNYRVLIDRSKRNEAEDLLKKLSLHIDLDEETLGSVLKEISKKRFQTPLLVKEYLSWEELSRVEFHSPELPGVIVDVGQKRYYPYADKAAHLTGYVGAVSEKEMEAENSLPLLRLPGFKVGKNGMEKRFEQTLRGTAGIKQVEVNVRGMPVRELKSTPSEHGDALPLTIDARLQQYAAERFAGESGGAVVMEVDTGNVLAFVSMPAYDPNSFSLGIKTKEWKRLNEDPYTPLLNKAITGMYPPGSTFKMITGLAALEAGTATPETRVFCPGYFMLGNHRFGCWKPEGHGSVNLREAIAGSCDTYFYTVGQRTGIDKIAEISRLFGLGALHGTGLIGEKSGLVPDKDWKQRRFKQSWQAGDTINASIGQGYVLATPLQMAIMTARMAGNGVSVGPRFVTGEATAPFRPLGIKPENMQAIKTGMEMVTNSSLGTAYGKRIAEERFAMAGKTGTSQVRRITVRGMNQALLPWHERHHAWFVGYAPVSAPKYAVSVLVEHGGGGSSAAAPVARDLLLKIQQLDEEDRLSLPPDRLAVKEEKKP